jgi:hypothetical protein
MKKHSNETKCGGASWLTKMAAAAAVTTAAAVTLAGPAHAYTYAGGAYTQQATTSGTYSDGTSAPAAPTQNLANLSRNMRAASKGVSAAVHFDPGLVSAGSSVAITVKWGNVAQTSGYYNNSYGSRFAFNFPPNDGSQRWEVINVTMTETVSGTTTRRTYSYTAGRSVPIQAIWDVTLSPLKFTLLDDCDWVGDSEIDLYFSHSAAYGTVSFGLSSGQSHLVNEFAKTWNEVGTSADLRVPVVNFSEEDPTGAWVGGGPTQTLSDQRLLPGTTHHTSFVENEATGQCRGQIDYDNIITIHTYNF